MHLSDFKILTFDCYGTLIDWETGLIAALRPLLTRVDSAASPDSALELFGRLESQQQLETPRMLYPQVLAAVYTRLADQWGIGVSATEAEKFGASIPEWPAFADSVAALTYLRQYYRLVILSNVDRSSIRGSQARLQVVFDGIYTAQDIGSYKPALRNFEYMLQRLADEFQLSATDVLHVAQSLYHDHVPAKRLGLASAWIDRRHTQAGWGATLRPADTPAYDFRFESLAALVDAHREDMRV